MRNVDTRELTQLGDIVLQEWLGKLRDVCEGAFGSAHLSTAHAFAALGRFHAANDHQGGWEVTSTRHCQGVVHDIDPAHTHTPDSTDEAITLHRHALALAAQVIHIADDSDSMKSSSPQGASASASAAAAGSAPTHWYRNTMEFGAAHYRSRPVPPASCDFTASLSAELGELLIKRCDQLLPASASASRTALQQSGGRRSSGSPTTATTTATEAAKNVGTLLVEAATLMEAAAGFYTSMVGSVHGFDTALAGRGRTLYSNAAKLLAQAAAASLRVGELERGTRLLLRLSHVESALYVKSAGSSAASQAWQTLSSSVLALGLRRERETRGAGGSAGGATAEGGDTLEGEDGSAVVEFAKASPGTLAAHALAYARAALACGVQGGGHQSGDRRAVLRALERQALELQARHPATGAAPPPTVASAADAVANSSSRRRRPASAASRGSRGTARRPPHGGRR